MRIIGGSARGRRLSAPKHNRIRPTADRVKESLFSILTSMRGNFSDCRVLDICAGTGNLGIEALSRGAAITFFIDNHRESAQLMVSNLSLSGLSDRGKVIQKDAIDALNALAGRETPFHLIFLDPPYRQGLAERILEHLATSPLVDESTIVVAEVASQDELSDSVGPMVQFDRRTYGDTALAFFRLNGLIPD